MPSGSRAVPDSEMASDESGAKPSMVIWPGNRRSRC
jgi:hypothetical protein